QRRGGGGVVAEFMEGHGQVEEALRLVLPGIAAAVEVGGGVAPAGNAVRGLGRQVLGVLGAGVGVGYLAGELKSLPQLLRGTLLGEELARLVHLLALGVGDGLGIKDGLGAGRRRRRHRRFRRRRGRRSRCRTRGGLG